MQSIFAQNEIIKTGRVNYISSQFTYVKFPSTEGIKINDTLFVRINKKLSPKLIVNSLSSHSLAAKVIGKKISLNKKVVAVIKLSNKNLKVSIRDAKNKQNNKTKNVINRKKHKTLITKKNRITEIKNIRGKFSISGYSNLSNINGFTKYQRWRYTFSLEAEKIANTNFSFSDYIVFSYRADRWHLLNKNFGNAFKIYELAGKYKFNKNSKIIFGRKINSKISNIGAIDGIQFETEYKKYKVGAILGSRPDFNNYGFNLKLFQFGTYVNKIDSVRKGIMQNTISVFQQMNSGATDRRFIYLQHSNNILPKINIFFSSEIELFSKIKNKNLNSLKLTSIYFSAGYYPYRWFSLNASYDARKNVIYYETFKNYVSRLLDEALRQGFRIRINLRPITYMYVGIYSSYRFRNNDIKATKNFGVSITPPRLPILNISTNVNYTNLNTNYLSGNIWGLRISKDFLNGKITTSLNYKNINYKFTGKEIASVQNIISTDFFFELSKMISMSVSFEGTYRKKENYSNIYLNFTTKF